MSLSRLPQRCSEDCEVLNANLLEAAEGGDVPKVEVKSRKSQIMGFAADLDNAHELNSAYSYWLAFTIIKTGYVKFVRCTTVPLSPRLLQQNRRGYLQNQWKISPKINLKNIQFLFFCLYAGTTKGRSWPWLRGPRWFYFFNVCSQGRKRESDENPSWCW